MPRRRVHRLPGEAVPNRDIDRTDRALYGCNGFIVMVALLAPQAPTSLFANRYELREQIGHGGMGTVFRAVDRLRGQTVALKRVYWHEGLYWPRRSSTYGMHDDLTLALAHEFRILASMRHPNIISVLDYDFDAERKPYFTMDVLE